MTSVVLDRTGGEVQMHAVIGATFHDQLTVYTDRTKTATVNLTGYTFQMTLRDLKGGSGTVLATSPATITIDTSQLASGVVAWSIASTTTDDLTATQRPTVVAELWWQSPAPASVREPLMSYRIKLEERTHVWV